MSTNMLGKDARLGQIVIPLLAWYEKNKRTLPWRGDKNPYHIWVSEIMLQQTRVEAVKGYYSRFIGRFPCVGDLAKAGEDELMKLWQGLGYYSRARNLQKAAQMVIREYNGRFPEEYGEILKLPGIGEYTAGAVASIAFGKPVPAVDGNVCRIYARLSADGSDVMQAKVRRQIRDRIAQVMPSQNPGEFNQALMDLGAIVCLPNGRPLCGKCPVSVWCAAWEKGVSDAYPVKAKKKPRRQEGKTVFLLEYQGKYLIRKRPQKGLLAGLWEFPSQEGRLLPGELKPFLDKWGIGWEQVEPLGDARHIFTHLEWHMLGYLIHLKTLPLGLSDGMVLSSASQLQGRYSIPSAYSAYLNQVIDRDALEN